MKLPQKNIKKVVLIGGVGNQLFILWRALSYTNNVPEILQLTKVQQKLTSLLGWSIQKDWIGIEQIATELGFTVRYLKSREIPVLLFMFVLKKLKLLRFDEELTQISSGHWDFGYFQKAGCVDMKILPRLVKCISTKMPQEPTNDLTIIHDRAGDFEENRRLPEAEVVEIANSYGNEIRLISAHSSKRFKDFLNISSDECHDLNSIRSATRVIMTCSTFAFWGVMLSNNPKMTILYTESDNLSDILLKVGKNVDYLK